jgi:hypothetical protein
LYLRIALPSRKSLTGMHLREYGATPISIFKQWKFDPATEDGRAVAVQINVEVSFKLY